MSAQRFEQNGRQRSSVGRPQIGQAAGGAFSAIAAMWRPGRGGSSALEAATAAVDAYRPFQTGSRFSAKARAPSSWSSEE